MAIPTFFELPCILGGAILVICAVVYLIAALKGEAWVELTPPRERQKPAGTIIEAPTRAPPRLPSISKMETSSSGATLVGNEVVAQNAVALTVVNEDISVAVPAPPRKPSTSGKAAAKPQWIGRLDAASGNTYYENLESQQTQWELPAGIVVMEEPMQDLSI
eukprot:gene6690-3743_t